MTTSVVLTGTGVPRPDPRRAGPGVLITTDEVALQFDAGRATTMRMAEAGITAAALDAVFITHHHSDHVVGLVDIVMSRWLQGRPPPAPLAIVAPVGPSARFVQRMLDPWDDDIAVRSYESPAGGPTFDLQAFDPSDGVEPIEVWTVGGVTVTALAVHHEPVEQAVGYRISTPDGVIAISGDTVACAEVEQLAASADVLVHEAFHRAAVEPFFDAAPHLRAVADYHADTPAIGASAARAGVATLLLTHLVPAPSTPAEEQSFIDAVRAGGYQGEIIVGHDLTTVTLPPGALPPTQ